MTDYRDERALLRQLFDAAVDAAAPARLLGAHLPPPPKGRLIVLGAGKAAAAMAAAFEVEWAARGENPAPEGLVVTRYGHGVPTKLIEVVEAAHPEPDEAGRRAAARILALAEGAGEDDLVVALISGGGSALLTLPAPGIAFGEKQAINRALLASGAPIGEMNAVRKHLSAIKGGRLAAAAYPAPVLTLAISDVPGDEPSVIASGPTVADATTFADAREILRRRKLDPAPSIAAYLEAAEAETPKPGDARLARAEFRLIGAPMKSLEAAARVAEAAGFRAVVLGDALEGEARELGAEMAARALGETGPVALISGGETTVTLNDGEKPKGRGGRNVEFLLGLASALDGAPGVLAIAGDTDGVDGMAEIAGAIVDPETPKRATDAGVSLDAALGAHDGHGFFEATGDQVITGPTLTNVNDFRAILVRRA
ncbi:glycerate kinase [Pikeienuella piscinae]|uniref:Glycerate kinase n=1 Tax=Pikeienuella piscinae TaxID=2748098 RepID=A0A7L5BY96_9RHOB|nr:glycerate kinase [Pikeienuella piscinae]QIE56895.1 glycerate kinase [Pikeienuella piscinae]